MVKASEELTVWFSHTPKQVMQYVSHSIREPLCDRNQINGGRKKKIVVAFPLPIPSTNALWQPSNYPIPSPESLRFTVVLHLFTIPHCITLSLDPTTPSERWEGGREKREREESLRGTMTRECHSTSSCQSKAQENRKRESERKR